MKTFSKSNSETMQIATWFLMIAIFSTFLIIMNYRYNDLSKRNIATQQINNTLTISEN